MNLATYAREWLGTPYVHQASKRQVGADCLGLVLGVLQEAGHDLQIDLPDYSADWGEQNGFEYMLEAGRKYLEPVGFDELGTGDILVFRWNQIGIAKHAGILSSLLASKMRFIHAYERGGVVEVSLNRHWQKRIAGCFRVPRK